MLINNIPTALLLWIQVTVQCCGWVRDTGDGGFSPEQPPTTFIILYKGSRNSRKREAKGTVFFNKYVILWLCLQLRQKRVYTSLISFPLLFLGSFKKEIKPSYDFFLNKGNICCNVAWETAYSFLAFLLSFVAFKVWKEKKSRKKTEVQTFFFFFF